MEVPYIDVHVNSNGDVLRMPGGSDYFITASNHNVLVDIQPGQEVLNESKEKANVLWSGLVSGNIVYMILDQDILISQQTGNPSQSLEIGDNKTQLTAVERVSDIQSFGTSFRSHAGQEDTVPGQVLETEYVLTKRKYGETDTDVEFFNKHANLGQFTITTQTNTPNQTPSYNITGLDNYDVIREEDKVILSKGEEKYILTCISAPQDESESKVFSTDSTVPVTDDNGENIMYTIQGPQLIDDTTQYEGLELRHEHGEDSSTDTAHGSSARIELGKIVLAGAGYKENDFLIESAIEASSIWEGDLYKVTQVAQLTVPIGEFRPRITPVPVNIFGNHDVDESFEFVYADYDNTSDDVDVQDLLGSAAINAGGSALAIAAGGRITGIGGGAKYWAGAAAIEPRRTWLPPPLITICPSLEFFGRRSDTQDTNRFPSTVRRQGTSLNISRVKAFRQAEMSALRNGESPSRWTMERLTN